MVLNQLKNMLIPLKIYGNIDNTFVESELCAYAKGISLVKERIELLLQEGISTTATSYGLNMFEEMMGLNPIGTESQRRDKILRQLKAIRGQWNLKDFNNRLDFDGHLNEEFNNHTLKIVFNNPESKNLEDLSSVFIKISDISPAHLLVNSNLQSKTFDQFDAIDKTFMNYDELELCFDCLS